MQRARSPPPTRRPRPVRKPATSHNRLYRWFYFTPTVRAITDLYCNSLVRQQGALRHKQNIRNPVLEGKCKPCRMFSCSPKSGLWCNRMCVLQSPSKTGFLIFSLTVHCPNIHYPYGNTNSATKRQNNMSLTYATHGLLEHLLGLNEIRDGNQIHSSNLWTLEIPKRWLWSKSLRHNLVLKVTQLLLLNLDVIGIL